MQNNTTHPDRWDMHWFARALEASRMSKDPNTQVGAVLVQGDQGVSEGWNGFPRGISDTEERLQHRDMKMDLVICAERNAILNAARLGIRTLGATLYLIATDHTGEVWGGPPCKRCTLEAIQAGVSGVVALRPRKRPSRWHADMPTCRAWLGEAGVSYRELDLPHPNPLPRVRSRDDA